MAVIKNLEKVNDYCVGLGLSALHPLISLVNLSEGSWNVSKNIQAVRYNFYAVFLKQGKQCVISYGRKNYDYQDGTLVFVGPGQVVNIENLDTNTKPSGFALLFHPDVLHGTALGGEKMDQYSFFSYDLNEALHVSHHESRIVKDCFDKIRYELSLGIDQHTKRILVSNIELFLNYCSRFYDRQFITRDNVHSDLVNRFYCLLNAYYKTGKAKELGVPSVSYFADELNLTANYFGDLVKKETGKSALDHVQSKIIEVAKDRIFDPEKSVNEIAYEMGFKHPQHFSRMFKRRTGLSPSKYGNLN